VSWSLIEALPGEAMKAVVSVAAANKGGDFRIAEKAAFASGDHPIKDFGNGMAGRHQGADTWLGLNHQQ
jgi:hypothetical protein